MEESNKVLTDMLIHKYLMDGNVNFQSQEVYLLKDCIVFWENTEIEELEGILKENPYNLYVDLAIYHERGINKIAKMMWIACYPEEKEFDVYQLNMFLLKGISFVQDQKKEEQTFKTYSIKKNDF